MYNAIKKLAYAETGNFNVFSGLSGVKLKDAYVSCGSFVTYVSSSWEKDVATAFIYGDNGMMITIDKQFKKGDASYYHTQIVYSCDVSWISRFPDECEILFARSTGEDQLFTLEINDKSSNGIQQVSLTKKQTVDGWKEGIDYHVAN